MLNEADIPVRNKIKLVEDGKLQNKSYEDIKWKTEVSLYDALINARELNKPMLVYFIEMALVEFEDTFVEKKSNVNAANSSK